MRKVAQTNVHNPQYPVVKRPDHASIAYCVTRNTEFFYPIDALLRLSVACAEWNSMSTNLGPQKHVTR